MSEAIDFQPDFLPYLNAIRQAYGRWWDYYTVTDAQERERRKPTALLGQAEASPFDFGLMVQTVAKNDARRTPNPNNSEEPPEELPEKIERLPVLDGLRKYAFDEKTRHLLLVGRPGSGKSTALARLLLEEADRFSAGTADTIPVLVELRYWKKSIEVLMLEAFRRHGLELDGVQLDRLLSQNRLLVLMDGMNELPTEEGRSQLTAFRRKYSRVSAIFTTRDLSLGGDAGIEQKLEMQPLTEPQMQIFVEAYLPERGEVMWRQLQGRLREFGETPLLLWMLCEVVKQSPNAQLPTNLAGIFQVFTQAYEVSSVRKHQVAALKGDTRSLSDRHRTIGSIPPGDSTHDSKRTTASRNRINPRFAARDRPQLSSLPQTAITNPTR
ncbi:MAG: NACHT domain-containing protein [Cyanobacteriota bacterium]|nr:NACHT domain-containing protein [Cyanobacteriota bacterium]